MKRFLIVLICISMIFTLVACGRSDTGNNGDAGQTGETKTVKMGYVNWAEGVAMTYLAKASLEDKMGYEVEATMADVAPIFTSLASGNTDVFVDTWLPVTHASQMERYGDDIDDLGVVVENAFIGLVVPSYVEANSIEDLNDYVDEFGGEIIGIDSGAGIMEATERAIEEYGLNYKLLSGSGPTMTAALAKAIESEKAIVVTGWAPHWKFARFDLKRLEDPKGVYGDVERIHISARKGFVDDMPEVAEFFSNYKFTDEQLGSLMAAIEDHGGEPIEAAREWMLENEELVNSWLPVK